IEEKQLDGGGIPGEDREIHSFLVDSGTERVRSAGPRLERSQGPRFPNFGFLLGDGKEAWHDKVSGSVGSKRLRCGSWGSRCKRILSPELLRIQGKTAKMN